MYFIYLWRPDNQTVQNCVNSAREGSFNYDAKWHGTTRQNPLPVSSLRSEGFVIQRRRTQVGRGKKAFLRASKFVKKWGHFQLEWADVDPATPIYPESKLAVRARSLLLWTLNPLQVLYVEDELREPTNQKLLKLSRGSGARGGQGGAATGAVAGVTANGATGTSADVLLESPRRRFPLHRGTDVEPWGALTPRIRRVDGGPRGARSMNGLRVGPPLNARFAFGHGTLHGHFLAGEERFAVEWSQDDDCVWYEVVSFSKPANIVAHVTCPLVRVLQSKFMQDSTQQVIDAVRFGFEEPW